ncbi:hypothetical protein GUITHDRAFT_141549 [Guillardia theta CCMP2712]|uniref:Uncharacterized protein n=1 Tax=Guillardia theta (strain CCMP2712) TaxID=905079 RepID=L1J0P3_GUITC|nr:hypothetical protein GUITHDRAFT_141549 [Guillardia theta CCMP2712]EKX42081.1 hypothetical protein GUITHDRAFT_141549 [Guillardia theta CCMP2712]|eukprot:XP_005829061.1 hypothetical protein GUITHDRAFT_141549 [Guillardia theta CCMP2712]
MEMMLVRRLQKSANRDETKELIETLDSIVPLFTKTRRHRSCLKSGRSLTQLLLDIQQRVGDLLKVPESPKDNSMPDQTIRLGMLDTRQPILILDRTTLNVLSLSCGARECFKGLPFDGPTGQNILHFISSEDRNKILARLRNTSRSGESLTERLNFRITSFRTMMRGEIMCELVSTHQTSEGHIFFFFTTSADQTCKRRSLHALLESFSGTFGFDNISSTELPWDRRHSKTQSEISYMFSGWKRLFDDEQMDQVISEACQGCGIQKNMLKARELQVRCNFVNANKNGTPRCDLSYRWKLSALLGTYDSGWKEDQEVDLNGKPKSVGNGKFISFCVNDDSDEDRLHITEYQLQMKDENLVIEQSSSIYVTNEALCVLNMQRNDVMRNRDDDETRLLAFRMSFSQSRTPGSQITGLGEQAMERQSSKRECVNR